MKLKLIALLSFTVIFLAACSDMSNMDHSKMNMSNSSTEQEEEKLSETKTTVTQVISENEITLVAKEAAHQLNNSTVVNAWTFNGSVPGSQIRVQEGEDITIHLKNELKDPVSIHWHGLPIPNAMDGIPGVTQNAVQPGETFTYEFTATVTGTYMYHTHQDGVNQLDKGLYGSFIVEPANKTYDRDYSLMLDEWMSDPKGSSMSNMEDMDHGKMNDKEKEDQDSKNSMSMEDMGHNMDDYDIFTINGKSGDLIEPLQVKEGKKVRIRLANIGFMSHKIHLHGHKFKVVAIDGQELNAPQELENQLLSIAPGERYDIEFIADNPGVWYLECHGEMTGTEGMKTKIQYEGYTESKDKPNPKEKLPEFNFNDYGEAKSGFFEVNQQYDLEYTMNLDTEMEKKEMVYTINGKTFPETENIIVKEGDNVKVKLVNNSSTDDHPMHLHGQFFQVLSKNGKPLEGSPIIKDTINVKPGEEYEIAFKTDNPGNWLFHCHDLHHAAAGMVTQVKYEGFKPDFNPDPEANNKPE
ncbi:multicopper oxidase family protein [Sutcliffiella sp. NPDC057660]|uniref:multicopper oxidase family protein n=1 Tax=Sutcliffiella sp. NPDC057660 TaxID=3346199 RepID=UPI0036C76404